jgi:predicted Zn-ribbon and HTH transcriptional regulator
MCGECVECGVGFADEHLDDEGRCPDCTEVGVDGTEG